MYFGFDCNHYDDSLERWPLPAVVAETENLARQMAKYKFMNTPDWAKEEL